MALMKHPKWYVLLSNTYFEYNILYSFETTPLREMIRNMPGKPNIVQTIASSQSPNNVCACDTYPY